MLEEFKAKLLIIDLNFGEGIDISKSLTYRNVRFKVYESGLLIIERGNETNDYVIIKDYISLTIRSVQEHKIKW